MGMPSPKYWISALAFWWLPGGVLWAITGLWPTFAVGVWLFAVILSGYEES